MKAMVFIRLLIFIVWAVFIAAACERLPDKEFQPKDKGGSQMTDLSKIDYSALDRPEILMFLFHPRPEFGAPRSGAATEEISIPVERSRYFR